MASFVETYFPQSVGKPDNNVRTSFPFNNCVNKRIIFWEEPYITSDNVEDVKCLLSGTKFSTDIKYQSAVEIEKTPVFVTANRTPWHARSDVDVWTSRCFTFRLNEPIKETTDLYFFPFTRGDWIQFFLETTVENLKIQDGCDPLEPSYLF
jgi:hypothetical protein